MDFAEYGNINESMPKQSVHSLIQIVTQLSSALEYVDSKSLIHLRISAASIFVVKPGKVQVNYLSWLWALFSFQGEPSIWMRKSW